MRVNLTLNGPPRDHDVEPRTLLVYIGALKALVVGQLKFTVRTYDADPVNGSIRRIKFQAEFRTPGNFEFDPALKPKPAAFPSFSD